MKDQFATNVELLELRQKITQIEKRVDKMLRNCIHLADLVEELYVISRPLREEVPDALV